MNQTDFRKPYEYTEEKRGLLLVFIIMMVCVDLYLIPSILGPAYNHLKHIPVLGIGFLLISALFVLLILLTMFSCYHLQKNLVFLSKAYLVTRVVIMIPCIIALYFTNLNGDKMISFGSQYATVGEYTISGLVYPILFVLVFSVGWFVYFVNSKRCKEIIERPENSVTE